MNTSRYRMIQKTKTLVFLLFSIILVTLLEYFYHSSYTQPYIVGIGGSAFHASPWGYKLLANVDNLLNQLKKEG